MAPTGDVVKVVDPVIPPEAAVIVVEPLLKVAVTRPAEPGTLLMVAIAESDELQNTDPVISRGKLSEKAPMALSCVAVPGAMLELTGFTDKEMS